MSFRPIIKILIICQPEKVLILLGRSEVPWLHYFLLRYSNRRRAN